SSTTGSSHRRCPRVWRHSTTPRALGGSTCRHDPSGGLAPERTSAIGRGPTTAPPCPSGSLNQPNPPGTSLARVHGKRRDARISRADRHFSNEVPMRPRDWMPITVLLLFVMLPLAAPATVQEHIADPATVCGAIASVQATDEANRSIVLRALERDEVRQMEDRFGIDVAEASAAVSHMSGAELAELA